MFGGNHHKVTVALCVQLEEPNAPHHKYNTPHAVASSSTNIDESNCCLSWCPVTAFCAMRRGIMSVK